jgi:adenosylcobinamide-phosphate synthase
VLGFLYKSINTMDSMIGYKNEKYLYLGRAAAKLDDVVNYIPARLAALFMMAASAILRMDWRQAWRIYRRDRRKCSSPNAAQTESVCAGALDLELLGNAWYFGKLHEKPSLGDPVREIETADIRRANQLLYATAILFGLAGLLIRIGIVWKL